jgi:DNA polymerase elongation subunit (family B)
LKEGGIVLSIEKALIYEKYDYVFNSFVEYFNKFREKMGAHKILGKLIINSLYGKLGSSIKDTKYLIAYSEEELIELKNKNEVLSISQLNKLFIIEIRDKSKNDGINVGLAACITSKARIKLAESMIAVENNGGRMLYCDTDSLFIEFDNKIDYNLFS